MSLHRSALAFAVLGALSAIPANAALVHQYTFESNASALDAVGTANLNYANSPGFIATGTVLGQAVSFTQDGVNQAAGLGNDPKVVNYLNTGITGLSDISGVSGLTISVWVNRGDFNTAVSTSNTILTVDRGNVPAGSVDAGTNAFAATGRNSIQLQSSGATAGAIIISGRKSDDNATNNGNGARETFTTTATNLVPLNTWVLITAVYDYANEDAVAGTQNGTMKVYVNGVQAAGAYGGTLWTDALISGGVVTNENVTPNGLSIGAGTSVPLNDQEGYRGMLDEVHIYNTALTDAQVLADFQLFASAATPVPEPMSLGLLGVGAVALMTRRRSIKA